MNNYPKVCDTHIYIYKYNGKFKYIYNNVGKGGWVNYIICDIC